MEPDTMQSKIDRRVKLSPLGCRQNLESKNVSRTAVEPFEHWVFAQSTDRHEPGSLLQWSSSRPRKSFLMVLLLAPAKQKRALRGRVRT